MSHAKEPSITPVIKSRIHDIQAVLPLPESGDTFRAKDVPLDPETTHGVLLHLKRQGHIEQLSRVGNGNKAHRYRWVDDAKGPIRDYIDTLDTLPCDCRGHVPDTRDDPPGKVSCKYCGRTYDREHFRSMLEGLL